MWSPTPALLTAIPVLVLAGCSSGIDVTLSRGALSLRVSDVGCGVSYSGDRGAGPSAVDITCPANLRPRGGAPSLHISTPLVTAPGPLALRDEHFREAGYQLGQFVVVTYAEGDRRVTCDPLQAKGAILYSAVPRPGAEGRLAGQFSEDAVLLNCNTAAGPDGNVPLQLAGSFDLPAPVP